MSNSPSTLPQWVGARSAGSDRCGSYCHDHLGPLISFVPEYTRLFSRRAAAREMRKGRSELTGHGKPEMVFIQPTIESAATSSHSTRQETKRSKKRGRPRKTGKATIYPEEKQKRVKKLQTLDRDSDVRLKNDAVQLENKMTPAKEICVYPKADIPPPGILSVWECEMCEGGVDTTQSLCSRCKFLQLTERYVAKASCCFVDQYRMPGSLLYIHASRFCMTIETQHRKWDMTRC